MKDDLEAKMTAAEQTIETLKLDSAKLEKQLVCDFVSLCDWCQIDITLKHAWISHTHTHTVLALDLEGVHDVKLHHPSSSVATSNQ